MKGLINLQRIWIWLRDRGRSRDHMADQDYVKSAARERAVKEEIERLSKRGARAEFAGYGTGVPIKFTTPRPRSEEPAPLDLEVMIGGESVAVVEVMGSDKYTFASSKFFPVALDKGERAQKLKIPAFFVFVLNKEPEPNMWWMSAGECCKYPIHLKKKTIYGDQDIYETDKYAWKRGLEGLVKEIEGSLTSYF